MLHSSSPMVCLCLVLLMSGASDSAQKRICDISLKIPEYSVETETETLGGNSDINNRSLSAWTWTPQVSPHRIPGVIFEAECRAQYCSDPSDPSGGLQAELNSVPIFHHTLVLQQDKQDRRCFTASFQKVAVGCTCIWAQTT